MTDRPRPRPSTSSEPRSSTSRGPSTGAQSPPRPPPLLDDILNRPSPARPPARRPTPVSPDAPLVRKKSANASSKPSPSINAAIPPARSPAAQDGPSHRRVDQQQESSARSQASSSNAAISPAHSRAAQGELPHQRLDLQQASPARGQSSSPNTAKVPAAPSDSAQKAVPRQLLGQQQQAPASSTSQGSSAAEEREALEWCWEQVRPTLESKPLELLSCRTATQLGRIFRKYGFGASGWVALRRSVEGAMKTARTLEEAEEELLPSFPSVGKDPAKIVGGLYMRSVQFAALEEILKVLSAYKTRESGKEKKLRARTKLALEDKEKVLRELKAVLTHYIGVTSRDLSVRIKEDQELADKGEIHGLQIQLYRLFPQAKRREKQFCLLETGHWATLFGEDAGPHARNAEKLFVGLFDKKRLMNIDDGGKSSREKAPMLSGKLGGILAGSKLMLLRRCNVRWSLDADADFLNTEIVHLVRLIQPLLGRPFEADEYLQLPDMLSNMLPDEAIPLLAKEAYSKARAQARDPAQDGARSKHLEQAQELGRGLLGKLDKDKATVLVMCSQEGWLLILDTLAAMGFVEVDVLGPAGWDHASTRWTSANEVQDMLLRRGVLRFRSAVLGINLWLFKTLNSTRAHHIGPTAFDHRAWTMAASLHLSQLVDQGRDPADDPIMQRLLTQLADIDFEYRCAVHVGIKMGALIRSHDQDSDECATGEGTEESGSRGDGDVGVAEDASAAAGDDGQGDPADVVDADVLAGCSLAEYEQQLRAGYRETYDAIVSEALDVDERARAAAGRRKSGGGRKKRAAKEGETAVGDEESEEAQRQEKAAKLQQAEQDKAERARIAAENKIIRRLNTEEIDRAADEKLAVKYGDKSAIDQRRASAAAAKDLHKQRCEALAKLQEQEKQLRQSIAQLAQQEEQLKTRVAEADSHEASQMEFFDDSGVGFDNNDEQDTRSDAPPSPTLSKRGEPPLRSPPSSPSKKRRGNSEIVEQQQQHPVEHVGTSLQGQAASERLSTLLADIHVAEERLAAIEGEIEKAKDSLAELLSSREENEKAFDEEREERNTLNWELGLLDKRKESVEEELGSLVKRKEKIEDDIESLLESAEAEVQENLRAHKAWQQQAIAEQWQAEERLWETEASLDAAQMRRRQWEEEDAQERDVRELLRMLQLDAEEVEDEGRLEARRRHREKENIEDEGRRRRVAGKERRSSARMKQGRMRVASRGRGSSARMTSARPRDSVAGKKRNAKRRRTRLNAHVDGRRRSVRTKPAESRVSAAGQRRNARMRTVD